MKKNLPFIIFFFVNILHGFSQGGPGASAYFRVGEIKKLNGDYAGAITAYTKVIMIDSTNKDALLQRGFCYIHTKNYDEALKDYNLVIRLYPDHKWAYQSRGSAYNRMEKYDLAIKDFEKVMELDPKDSEAYNNRGFSKKGKGDLTGACEDWNKSKRLGNGEAKIILENNRCK